jgi:hypothetical protein
MLMSKGGPVLFYLLPQLIDDTPLNGDYRKHSDAPLHGNCPGKYLRTLGWYDLRGIAGCVCIFLKPNNTRKKKNTLRQSASEPRCRVLAIENDPLM